GGPIGAGQAVQVVDDPPATHGQFTLQTLVAADPGAGGIDEPELALVQPQHSHVRHRADREVPELLLVDRAGAGPGRAQDHVLQGQAQSQELTHDVEHVVHACVHAVGVEVGGDRVGEKAFLDNGDGDAPGETAGAVANVEENAAAPADGQA